jgi:lipoprotein-anchoring transpeptidase ErfK/SrfK
MWIIWSGGVAAAIVAALLVAGTAISLRRTSDNRATAMKRETSAATARAADLARTTLAAKVRVAPASGSRNVGPATHVVVTAGVGRLTGVELLSSAGATVDGVYVPGGKQWWSTGQLNPSTSYKVIASASSGPGVYATTTSTFATIAPVGGVTATVFPTSDMHPGVGQAIVLRFSHPVTTDAARASLLSRLDVKASVPVAGGWHWFSPTELHFRPRGFWPPGDRVAFSWNLQSWDVGDGWWGSGAGSSVFTIGDAHVSTADLASHQFTVRDNGRVIAVYPMSGGRPSLPTMNGTHIVMDRESVVRMISSSNGIPVNSPDGYDELVYNDVHISDSGEYVHAAPWSVGSQGNTNVSHGCINLSNDNALAFFNFSRVGDIVQVVGGPRAPELGDHGVMDWDTDWSQWTPATAQPLSPPPPPPPAVSAPTAQ